MDKDHPSPRDMRWKADEPRWDDLNTLTAWDKFIIATAKHFKGKPVVLQLANEPGHYKWKNGNEKEYVKLLPANYPPMVWGNQKWQAHDHSTAAIRALP